jgi:hypothetical protein
MTESRPSLALIPVAGQRNFYYESSIAFSHGTVTADERYVVTNQGEEPAISVADLLTGQVTSFPLPGLQHVAGVAINRGWENTGLLAAHGGDKVAIYDFSPATGNILLEQVTVRNPKCFTTLSRQGPYGPYCTVSGPRVAGN